MITQKDIPVEISWQHAMWAVEKMAESGSPDDFCGNDVAVLRKIADGIEKMLEGTTIRLVEVGTGTMSANGRLDKYPEPVELVDVLYLPSGRIFVSETIDAYTIESTEMRDVAVNGKLHAEVRETMDPRKIWKHLVPYSKKWLLTVSTQKGCVHNCKFCDVAKLPYLGNLSQEEIESQIRNIILCSPYVRKCEKAKIGFARMGEPSWNLDNVLGAIENLPEISKSMDRELDWLPCFNSILPRKARSLERVLEFKERVCKGRLHLQISCNSTNEEQRKSLFGGADVFTLEEVIATVNKSEISSRTVTLNFIVMKGVEVSVEKLRKMGLSGDKFTVKLIPLNKTDNAESNGLRTYANYSNYNTLIDLGNTFYANGIPVVTDAIARCEEAGLCCGQLAGTYR